jgi:hypothetical protein
MLDKTVVRSKSLHLPEGMKPLEGVQVILGVLEEDFDAHLVSLEVTKSATRIEVLIPVASLR